MKENGQTITWKVLECISGQTEGSLKENTKMIRSKVMGSTDGLIRENIRGTGLMENSMDLGSIL